VKILRTTAAKAVLLGLALVGVSIAFPQQSSDPCKAGPACSSYKSYKSTIDPKCCKQDPVLDACKEYKEEEWNCNDGTVKFRNFAWNGVSDPAATCGTSSEGWCY
jgi:hypothetical protein